MSQRKSLLSTVLSCLLVLVLLGTLSGAAQAADSGTSSKTSPSLSPLAIKVTSLGYRANEGGGGKLDTVWTGGNLGNTWAEGEWVPYQLVIEGIGDGLAGLDSIVISFDFTRYGGGGSVARFVDLVRGIQVGTTQLDDSHGWVGPGGDPLPVTTRAEIEAAQNYPDEEIWDGFAPLNLPNEQINRTLDGGLDVPPGEEKHIIKIYKDDLLAAGVEINAPTVVLYYQLHESRTFIWENRLQAYYDGSPTDVWGGYLYGTDGWPTAASVDGSGYVPGSSGHVHLENLTGSQDVPIPIPERLPGIVSGFKWLDEDGDGLVGAGEDLLPGWEIHVFGNVEGIDFTTSILTGGDGYYSFPNLTSGTTWTIKEDSQRDVPSETGYVQTYPEVGDVYGNGTGVDVTPPPPGVADVGWEVILTLAEPDQGNMNFGNMLCEVTITCPPDVELECDEPTDPFNTGEPTVDGNCPPFFVSHIDSVIPGRCPQAYGIERTWIVTDQAGNADSCIQIITIDDTTPPDITCPPDTAVQCLDDVPDYDISLVSASDNCGAITVTWEGDETDGNTCPELITRTYRATDECDNYRECSQLITINDTIPPVITCPPNVTVDCDQSVDPDSTGRATAIDNCDVDIEITHRDAVDPVDECVTVITRTWTATDDCDNQDECDQIITVRDLTAPIITCPPNVTVDCDQSTHPDSTGRATAIDNCDVDIEIDYEDDTVPVDDCTTVITRTWTATDDCDNQDECDQTITVTDLTPPVITCPPDVTVDCDQSTHPDSTGHATAIDNCDADIEIDYEDAVNPVDECVTVITRTWTATDDCDNQDECDQIITVRDLTAPVITCPPNVTVDCDQSVDPDSTGRATARDNCDVDIEITHRDAVDPVDECVTVITRTWTATDDCDNQDECDQIITVRDLTAPHITCAPDDTIGCNEPVVFTGPTARDNCDIDLEIQATSNDTLPGPGLGETIYTRCWAAYDDCGNPSDTCCQSIHEFCPLCSYTIGGWGSGCPTPQQGDSMSTQPGCIRDHYFTQVFPNGVMVGDTTGAGSYGAYWTSAAAVEAFLPAGSTPGMLDADYMNPTQTSAGVLASQVLALRMNREYSCAGIFAILGQVPITVCYGSFEVPSECGKFAGLTVDQFLALADHVLAGDASVLTPYSATISDINFTATCLNEAFSDCDEVIVLSPIPIPMAVDPDVDPTYDGPQASATAAPTEFGVTGICPNPLNGSTKISYALPVEGKVTVTIYDVNGRRINTLVDGRSPAGYYGVVWNGKDLRGNSVASGVYFCRVSFTDHPELMRKLIKLQ